jgi:DNA-binding NtrC family response regulator
MPLRIDLADLPARSAPRPAWILTWRSGTRRASLPLADGESTIGSAAPCRLKAPGVAARHLVIKIDDDRLFVRAIGRATLRLDGDAVRRLTPFAPGQVLTFGEVTASVERLDTDDQQTAVTIAASPAGAAEREAPPVDPAAWQLGRLTTALAGTATADRLLHALQAATGATSLALYAVSGAAPADWTLLGAAVAGANESPLDAGAEDCARFHSERDDVVLLVRSDASTAWHDALCAHAVTLAAMIRPAAVRPTARRDDRPNDRKASHDPWDHLAGETVRQHLSASAEACRYCDTALLLGETGTGKELVAEGLHRLWQRAGPFVAINCAAVPGDLLDAELFGIEAGTATGVNARRGRLEQARGGTLMLDEVADLPLPLQTKLLRVLQEREYYSVGGRTLHQADVRIVAATNRTAEALCGGLMRTDLYFRLAQVTITLPPLRDRLSDLPALCAHVLNALEARFGRGVQGLSVSAVRALRAHAWPGNVRELQNVLRAVYAAAPAGGVARASHLPRALHAGEVSETDGTLASVIQDEERRAIRAQLDRSGSVPAAARALGLSEGYLYRKLRKLGLAPAARRAP